MNNPFTSTISNLNLSSDSPGEWGYIYLIMKAMGNAHDEAQRASQELAELRDKFASEELTAEDFAVAIGKLSSVAEFPSNAPREALRRIAMLEGTCPHANQLRTAMNPGLGFQRLEHLLTPSIIAHDAR